MLNSRTQKGRSEPRRVKNEVVQVFGLTGKGRPFHQTATTMDVSYRGARLRGVSCWDRPGEIIGVRCGAEKARFRVVWIGRPNTAYEAQVGLSCLEPNRNIWEQDTAIPQVSDRHLGPATPAMFSQPEPANVPDSVSNRRGSTRYRINGRAQARDVSTASWRWAMLCDLSLGGCYLEMPAPFAAGKQVEVNLTVAGIQLNARAEVTGCHPYMGMALQFKQLTSLNHERLKKLMEALARTQIPV